MPFIFVHQNITKVNCDVLVNPTDSSFSGSGGTDWAIHMAAGSELDAACKRLKPISFGETAVTDGFALPCKYIIHTMGPIWQGGNQNEEMLLRSCYINSLLKAKSLGVQSIAFPLISSGSFGFPKDKVLKIATDAISDFLFNIDSEMDVSLCVTNRSAFEISRLATLREYLDRQSDFFQEEEKNISFYVSSYNPVEGERLFEPIDADKSVSDFFDADERRPCASASAPMVSKLETAVEPHHARKAKSSFIASGFPSLSEWIKKQDKSFSEMLLDLIQQKRMKEVECYKKANVSKNTFSKIKNAGKPVPYKPSKPTVIAFAIAMELTMDETQQLLRSAGFSLSHNDLFDLIVEFYITNGIYDIYEINAALYQYDQICLGC